MADAAGVGRATVFTSVGGKPTLLRAAYDVALVGNDEPAPLRERPWAQPIRQATTQGGRIEAYADVITALGARLAGISEAFGGAASADPAVRQSWDHIRAERRAGAQRIVGLVKEIGPLRDGLEEAMAADIVWILNDPLLYHELVLNRAGCPTRSSPGSPRRCAASCSVASRDDLRDSEAGSAFLWCHRGRPHLPVHVLVRTRPVESRELV